jgi:hypothetical protein
VIKLNVLGEASKLSAYNLTIILSEVSIPVVGIVISTSTESGVIPSTQPTISILLFIGKPYPVPDESANSS